ncbi:MAG: ATP-grasp domain-containing protein [Methylobacter sp.]|nr:ATP-grasp domain-containing protein [Methylobacter sp.]
METLILIIAGSGRMLAQAAKNAGLKPLVIDLFADLDTQSCAEAFRQIPSLAEEHITPALEYFIKRYAVTQVIYGSGFEYYPESLYYLDSRLIILGNHPDTFAKLQNKQAFFAVLDELDIPYPEMAFSAPEYQDNWLIKPLQGHGGWGIKHYHRNGNDNAGSAVYWQKYQAGTQHSVLFLADGQQVQVIGFNTQSSIMLSETQEFIFSGIINNSELQEGQKSLITDWLTRLAPVFVLKGLNSLDFIQSANCSYILEINPRPSASMQLYDDDLLIRHIKASKGSFADYTSTDKDVKGWQIIYAEHDLKIPEKYEWPEWCMDLPESASIIRTGQPVCSIIAHQKPPQKIAEQLLIKRQIIINHIKRFQLHGI